MPKGFVVLWYGSTTWAAFGTTGPSANLRPTSKCDPKEKYLPANPAIDNHGNVWKVSSLAHGSYNHHSEVVQGNDM